MQIFVLKLSEKVYGFDHHKTAQFFLELSSFMFEKKKFKESIALHRRALYIFDLISSKINPNSLYSLHELQLLSEDQMNFESSVMYMEELLNRNTFLFGKSDERLLYILGKLAALKAHLGLYKQASILQARHFLILSRVLKNPDNSVNLKYKETLKRKLQESKRLKEFYVSRRGNTKQLKK